MCILSRMMNPVSQRLSELDRQARCVFWFVVEYKQAHDGNSPSFREISKKCSIPFSGAPLRDVMLRLTDAGLLKPRRHGVRARAIMTTHGAWVLGSGDAAAVASLSVRAREVYTFAAQYKRENDGNAPSFRQIGKACGFSAGRTAKALEKELIEAGLFARPQAGVTARDFQFVYGNWYWNGGQKGGQGVATLPASPQEINAWANGSQMHSGKLSAELATAGHFDNTKTGNLRLYPLTEWLSENSPIRWAQQWRDGLRNGRDSSVRRGQAPCRGSILIPDCTLIGGAA